MPLEVPEPEPLCCAAPAGDWLVAELPADMEGEVALAPPEADPAPDPACAKAPDATTTPRDNESALADSNLITTIPPMLAPGLVRRWDQRLNGPGASPFCRGGRVGAAPTSAAQTNR
jgi:hypothetical protein